MGKRYFFVLLSVVLMALAPARLFAQPETEADKIKNAAAAFDREDYAAAMPLYSQLLATHPNDPNYSYRFGVCMLFASSDKGKALPFLEDASKDPKCEIDVWFYLGRAYHLNYRFDEAITSFSKYKTLAGEKKAEKLQISNQIAMCKTGKKLLKAVTDITVLEKKELPVTDFFRSYNLEGYSGELLVKPDEFKTSLDRKKNETSIIFLSGEKNTLYYSSYGDDEANGKDIYRIVRLPTGGWSKPYNVGYPVNTEYDEDYPFLHPNGKVLYFASKGHNSMGGYDIFRSELNEETGTWQKPTNMDFAINSPDDDILFVTDFEEKTAWFASARNSPQGQMMVYHVVIERKPVNTCIIAGTFKPTGVDPTANAKITVRNEETNQPIGVYNSNSSTGKYLINLPNTGGKYTFTVEKSGIHTQTKTVFVPPQYEMKPIRQEIFYTESGGEQNLNVVTYFDDDTASFAPDFLRDKANLDVNPDDYQHYEVVDLGNPNTPNNPGNNGTSDPVDTNDSSDIPGGGTDPADNVPSSSAGSVTTAELISSAYENADATKQEAVALKQQSERAFGYAADLNQQAKDKQAEADKAKAAADALPEGPEKAKAQQEAARLQGEANALQEQTVAAFNVANGLTEDAKQKDNEAGIADQYAKALEAGSKQTGPRAMDEANSLEQQLNDVSQVRSQAEETAKNAQEEADKKRENLQIVKNQLEDAREEKKANEEQIVQLRADSAKEKDPDLRQGYGAQIEGVQEDIADNNAEIKKKQAQVDRMTNELNALDNQASAAQAAIAASKDPAVAPVAMTVDEKQQLSENVVAYQNRVDDGSATVVYAPVTNTNPNTTVPNATHNTQTPETDPNTTTEPVVTQPVADASAAIAGVQSDVKEKLAAAQKESDPVKREVETGDAHREAEKELTTKIALAQNELKSETDPKRKSAVQKNIDQYTQERDHQRELILASDQRLKDQQAVAAQNPETNPNTNSAAAAPVADAADVITDVQAAVSEEMQLAKNESDPVKREQMIGNAHRDAEQDLSAKIADAQNALKNETDPERKTAIQNNIDQYTQEKEKQHDLAVASDQRVKEQQAVAAQNPETDTNNSAVPETQSTVADAAVAISEVQGSVNEQLQAAQNESDPVKREELIGDAHREAEQELETKIAASQTALKNEADPERRKAIENNIAQYTQEKEKQHDLAVASDERATENSATADAVPQPEDPFAEYITGIADADTMSDPASREAKKAEVYSDWATRLESKIADDKKLLSATKVKAEKDSLKMLVAAEEQQLKDIRVEEKNAKAAEQAAVAQYNSPGARSDRAYDAMIAEANTNNDVAAREDAKEAIYTSWADSLDAETAKLGELAAKERNANKKAELNQQVQTLRTAAQEKREMADAAHVAADNARTGTAVTTNVQPLNNNAVTPGVVGGTQNTNVVPAGAVVEDDVTYSDPKALTALTERDALQNEAQRLHERQDSLIAAAGQANGEDKTELLADASDAQRQAWDKEAQASTKQGDANTVQFNANAALIDSYKTAASGQQSDKIEQAGLVNDEALVLLQRAKDKRAEAKLAGSPYARKQALDEAEELELKAIQKQQDAVRLYREAGVTPGAVVQNPNDPNARVGNPENQNGGTPNTNPQNTNNTTANNPNTSTGTPENGVTPNTNPQNPNNTTANNPNTNNGTPENGVTPNTNPQNTNNTTANNQNANNGTPENGVTPNTNPQNTNNTTANNPNTNNGTPENGVTPNTNPQNTNNTATNNQNTAAQNANAQPADPSNQSRVANQLKPGETFKITSQPNTQPIPVDPPVPTGIVYKVQVGAFRNPIPVDQFRGIQPLTAESVGNGITRYTAGLFTDFSNADAAKREIRAMGYSDAFVVAYKDGKRISIAEARGQGGNNTPVVQNTNPQNPDNGTPVNTVGTQQPNVQQPNTQQPNTQQPNTQAPGNQNVAPATDVKTTKELFYTVQVGVYSRPVSAAKLYNLSGLFSERTANGYTRYAAGKYNNVAAAVAAKENIVGIGVKDAFVTAYFEGERITLERAAELERSGVVPAGGGAANAQPNTPANTQTNTPANTQPQTQNQQQQPVVIPSGVEEQPQDMTPIPVIANTKPNIPDTGLVFSVQLGAYQQFVPIAMANRFLLFASKGVSIYRDSNSGLTVYQVGVYGTYKDAGALKDDAVAKGISDAFIVAWYNGEKIPVDEALKMRPQ
jgi:hypothetical protein